MLKKIALLIMLVLPMGVFAQSTLKFGHMTSTEIIPTMPEYTKSSFRVTGFGKKLY